MRSSSYWTKGTTNQPPNFFILIHDFAFILMTKAQETIIVLIIFLGIVFTMALAIDAYGQQQQQTNTNTPTQQVQEVKEQVKATDQQADATTLATAGGIGVAGIALAREYINSKKLKASDNKTDLDTGRSFLYIYRLIQTMDAMIPAVSKCLDQPFSADNMQKHMTIRMKLADDANATADYLKTTLNASVPSMTPSSSVIVADAKNIQEAVPVSTNTTGKTGTQSTTTTVTTEAKPGA
jgi:hypothetical protein